MVPRSYIVCWGLATVGHAVLVTSSASAAITDLRVMSFNVRTGDAGDGINSWEPTGGPDRRDYVVATIRNFGPDILGIQKDLGYQGDYIQNGIGSYSIFKRTVYANGTGERNAILYKTSRARLGRHAAGSEGPPRGEVAGGRPGGREVRAIACCAAHGAVSGRSGQKSRSSE